jgi:hypothetical protein
LISKKYREEKERKLSLWFKTKALADMGMQRYPREARKKHLIFPNVSA